MASVGTYIAVAAGSAVGGVARYGLSGWVAAHAGETFPWGTLAVNVSGSLLIGLIAGLNAADGRTLLQPTWREFLIAGVCGGYTTFSAFSLQTLNLLRAGDLRRAGGNAILSVLLCLAAVWLGHSLAMALHRARGA